MVSARKVSSIVAHQSIGGFAESALKPAEAKRQE